MKKNTMMNLKDRQWRDAVAYDVRAAFFAYVALLWLGLIRYAHLWKQN